MARFFGGFENRFRGVGVGFSPESRNSRLFGATADDYRLNSSSSAFASFRSAVSKPSVNQL
jgi:hypothetical protein